MRDAIHTDGSISIIPDFDYTTLDVIKNRLHINLESRDPDQTIYLKTREVVDHWRAQKTKEQRKHNLKKKKIN